MLLSQNEPEADKQNEVLSHTTLAGFWTALFFKEQIWSWQILIQLH